MKKLTLIIAVLLCVASVLTAQIKKKKPTIVVVPFDIKGIEASETEVLFEVFTNEIADNEKYRVVDRSSVDKIKEEHNFQNSEWSDSDKVAKLGKALNANMVVTGKIMSYEKGLVVTLRMLDVNTMEIVSPVTTQVNDISEFFDLIPNVVKKLTGEIKDIFMVTDVSVPKTKGESLKTTGKNYKIGDDGPGGGIIFYYSRKGFDVYERNGLHKRCHYLEVSKFDLGDIRWCSKKNYDTYCCNITTLTKLGTGKINTFKIIKSPHNGGSITKENCAALACYSYSTTTTKAGDWFLPSKDELKLLCKNLGKRIFLSNTTDDYWYWSSSEYTPNSSWGQKITDRSRDMHDKNRTTHSVRAVRAF